MSYPQFPVATACVRNLSGVPWPQSLLQEAWGWWDKLLPWRIRVALWNWTWGYKGGERINWRTKLPFNYQHFHVHPEPHWSSDAEFRKALGKHGDVIRSHSRRTPQ